MSTNLTPFSSDGGFSTTGNIDGNYFIGNGSQLTGVTATADTGNLTFSQSTIESNQSNAYINFNAFSAGDIDIGTNDGKNVVIRTDGSGANIAWTFDAVGNLILPQGGIVYETNIPYGGFSGKTIALVPSGGISADQQLLVYPTAGPDANHLHLTSGNLYNTELFLGNDDLYVKLGNSGNVVINSNDGGGNSAQWNFEPDANLSVPGNTVIFTPIATAGAGGNSITIQAGSSDTFSANPGGNLNLIGGYGSFGDGGGPPGGDVNITSGGSSDSHAGNVTINAGSNTWTFDYNGVATLPGEGILRSIDDTINLVSFNTTTGNANSVYLGSSGGLGFADQEIGGNWLEIFRNGAEPEIRVPVGRGNLNIQTAEGINAYNWTFDNTGNLTVPGRIIVAGGIVGSGASPAPTLSGFSSVSAITVNASGNISATGNVTGGNLISSATIRGNVDIVLGNIANTSATKTRIVSFDANSYIQTGNGISGTTGNIIFSPYSDGTARVSIDTSSGNLTAAGNILAGGRVVTVPVALANLTAVAGGRAFINNGNLVAVGNFGAQVGSGGSNVVPVWSDGTNWYIG